MVEYDPYSDEIMEDPYRIYERLRNESPVHFIEEYDCWFVSRFETVWNAANDASHLHTMKGTTPGHLLTHDTPPSMSFNAYDPPEHTPMRAQIKKLFVPVAVSGRIVIAIEYLVLLPAMTSALLLACAATIVDAL